MAERERRGEGRIERWSRLMVRLRWVVLAAWAAVFVASMAASASLADLLTNRFAVPGSNYQRAETLLEREFDLRSDGTFSVVVRATSAGASTAALVADAGHAADRVAGVVPGGRAEPARALGDRVALANVVTQMEQGDAKVHTAAARRAMAEVAPPDGSTRYLTGSGPITYDIEPVNQDDLKRGELYFGVPVALLVLLLVFRSAALLLPLLFAAMVIPATLGVVWGVAHAMELSVYITNLVVGIGLGVSIDYSLLAFQRYREERRRGVGREDAVVHTMATAGRAVVFSGSAVAIGLALLLLLPLPFLQGFGVAGLVIPIVSVACALTLVPALLYLLADPLDRVRLMPARRAGADDGSADRWMRLANAIMRRPVVFLALSLAVLLAAAAPTTDLELSPGSEAGFPERMESIKGLDAIKEAVGEGAMAPAHLVIDTGRRGGADDPELQDAVRRLVDGLRDDREVAAVNFGVSLPGHVSCGKLDGRERCGREGWHTGRSLQFPTGPEWVDDDRRYVRVEVVNRHEYGLQRSMRFVRRMRGEIVDGARLPEGAHVYAGGAAPSGVAFLDAAYDRFAELIVAVLLVTYVLLLRAFRSLVLPLKAIVLNMLSIGAAYGLMVLAFKHGWGEPFGLHHVDQVEGWIPIFMFAMLFGLSMDYEVFLVSRMREEWDAGATNERAVALGLARTGGLVTAAGAIMVAAFGGFMAASFASIQQFGFGLAASILIDVTIVRTLLLPAAMKLFGRWNWWLPVRVARVVRVEPSPLAARVRDL